MSVALASLRRDFLVWSSYRMAAFWQLVFLFVLVAIVYFVGEAIGERSDIIDEEDGSYVAFVLVGIAFVDVLLQGMTMIARVIKDQQRAGTLEPMLLAPISSFQLLTSFWIFHFLSALGRMLIILGCGILVLGFWHSADPISVIVLIILAELTFVAIGAFSAAAIVLVKQGDPFRLAYTAMTMALGGAFFPVDALPKWVQYLSAMLPLTHALSGIREGLAGGNVFDVAPQIITLGLMAALLFPAGLFAFNWAINRAKMEGSVGEY